MRISFLVDNASVRQASWFLVFNNKRVCISDTDMVSFDVNEPGKYEIQIENSFYKKNIFYVLLWLGNLLIAPLNIILMNVNSEWHQHVCPMIFWRCKCNVIEDLDFRFRIVFHDSRNKATSKYGIEVITPKECISDVSCQKIYSKDSVNWEMNKYLSRLFSFEVWAFLLLYLIFRYVSFNNWHYVAILVGTLFVVIFWMVTIYTVNKARTLQRHF